MELSNIIIYIVYDFYQNHDDNRHTTLYGSAAGCRSIQKTCAL